VRFLKDPVQRLATSDSLKAALAFTELGKSGAFDLTVTDFWFGAVRNLGEGGKFIYQTLSDRRLFRDLVPEAMQELREKLGKRDHHARVACFATAAGGGPKDPKNHRTEIDGVRASDAFFRFVDTRCAEGFSLRGDLATQVIQALQQAPVLGNPN